MSGAAQALRPDPTPIETPFDTIKTKQQKAWTSGDYAIVGTTLQIVGESLCEAVDVCAGEKVLDVAAGNGNATLAGAKSPALWGTESRISGLFGKEAEDIAITRKQFKFRYASPEHFLAVFRTFYGPVHNAFEALDQQGQKALYDDFMELLTNLNRCRKGTLLVPSDYLAIVVTKA